MYGYTLLPRSDKTTIDNKEHIKFRSNPPKQELLEKLARISMVSKHEIGHLAHEHIQAKKNAHNTIITAETTLNIVFGAHILKTALTKTISKPGLLGRIVSIGALLPVTRFCSLYSLAAISRKQ